MATLVAGARLPVRRIPMEDTTDEKGSSKEMK
jgi:hypothetical protein